MGKKTAREPPNRWTIVFAHFGIGRTLSGEFLARARRVNHLGARRHRFDLRHRAEHGTERALAKCQGGGYAALMVDVMIGATLMSPAMVRVLFLLLRQRAPGHDSGGIDR